MKLSEAALIGGELKVWTDKYIRGRWSYKNGVINATGNIVIDSGATEILLPFGKVRDFRVEARDIVDCKNFPKEVNDIYVCDTKLSSLSGFPQKVKGDVDLRNNRITSLEGLPNELKGSLHLSKNKLRSLRGCPQKIDGAMSISYNQVESLEGFPEYVGRNLWLQNNKLTSLEGIHKIVKRIDGKIDIGGNPITHSIIDLLLIEGLREISTGGGINTSDELDKAVNILNKYVGKGKSGILDAQAELDDNDLDDFAGK